MKSRPSTHLLVILIIAALTALGHYTVYYGALIRGYETSWLTAGRNLILFVPFMLFVIFLSRFARFSGNWTLYTTAILLFSLGLVGQYRVFSDPEYSPRGKAEAREAKLETLQLRYIKENYSADKKRMMGLEATPPAPVNLSDEKPRPATVTTFEVLFSSETRNLILAFAALIGAFVLFKRDKVLDFLQHNGFLLVLLTLPPLIAAAVTSQSGKSINNMTPWETAKVPFLLGFAAILTILYKNLSKTFWGLPRAKDVVPLVVMAILPFVPFLLLKDFGQMLVFAAAYTALYLIAVRRLPQRIVFVGSVALVVAVLMLSALPTSVQVKVPLLSTVAEPVKTILPPRIHQRFHLWFDALTPPPPDTDWWKDDLRQFYEQEYSAELIEKNPELGKVYEELNKKETTSARRSELRAELKKVSEQELQTIIDTDEERINSLNEEAWFADDAMQASRATFGLSSGGKTGRGLGLGYPELIPVADSDYIYAALGEELGLFGGFIIILALVVFVNAGVRTALDSRDMFSKLCAAGLTAFIGFQALVNIGGITRALPMTGITLPFVSHGGFSLITSFAMLGMLLAISHRNGEDAQAMAETSKQKVV